MIRGFKDRDRRCFCEGRRIAEGCQVAAFQGFVDQAARRPTLLDSPETLGDLATLPGNRLEALRGVVPVSTAFGSTSSGASASAGPRKDPATWRSWTITEGGRRWTRRTG